MNTKSVIDNLKSEGCEVKVLHERTVSGAKYEASKPVKMLKELNVTPFCKGGKTFVFIKNKEGMFSGMAECSLEDNFNKKRGVQIALGRALKNFKKNNSVEQIIGG